MDLRSGTCLLVVKGVVDGVAECGYEVRLGQEWDTLLNQVLCLKR